jgi:hypothetical protein
MTVVSSDLDDEEGRLRRLQGLAAPVVSLASIVVSFLGPTATMYSWLLLATTDPLVRRLRASRR